ncbi:hypothetical protein NP233_g1905 [Leucocoprinus birnbaumii]|uniref:Uncharacterized protein n=1 Tax=Leucocoprinus birnbaumii TaxID=56174 RepID=A0AAD5VZR5_9AGAR|nr:hypothetical protein NP233_g1905 [Leucocoprinus birnbaumii]
MFSKFFGGLGILVLGSSLSLAKVVPLIQPGFFFDYDRPIDKPLRIPITANKSWNPHPNSAVTTPFIIPAGNGLEFDWDVPFAPGTQYQICMFDTNGVPGGCQAMYTVVKNSTVENPVCANVTAPPQLAIDGMHGHFDYTQRWKSSVSPPLHPPFNITSQNMDPIVWTVSLSWASPFFMSLLSSDGQMWASGPMHAGGFGPSDCLAPGTIPKKKASGIAAGASVGSLIAGVILGYGGLRLFGHIQGKRLQNPENGPFQELKDNANDQSSTVDSDNHSIATVSSPQQDLQRPLPEVPDRFATIREKQEWNPYARPSRNTSLQSTITVDTPSTSSNTSSPPRISSAMVIQHRDGGRIRPESQSPLEETVELPPAYRRRSMSSVDETSVSSTLEGESGSRNRRRSARR